MNIDVRTPTEKARAEKHRQICNDYLALKEQIPNCKPNRIFAILSKKYEMTIQGLAKMVRRYGLY